MKKEYIAPEMEVTEYKFEGIMAILAPSEDETVYVSGDQFIIT